ncbi:MAG: hypothetical protein EAZ55_09675 [Cytophagales bacterium]|nr:MAG: hypothetical protein EAZ55_09675 [Cytophagales bacterium]
MIPKKITILQRFYLYFIYINLLFISIGFIPITVALAQVPFEESAHFINASQFVKTHQKDIQFFLSKAGAETPLVIAIAFPELLRFNQLQNHAEVTSLEFLYVNFGENYADFSIGYFQMKPSFVQKIEELLASQQLSSFQKIYSYNTAKSDIEIRKARIERLNNIEWQLQYLNAFYWLMEISYRTKYWTNTEEKLRFYAAAYNYGFWKPEKEIVQWRLSSKFKYDNQYYNYTTLAWLFYEKSAKFWFK